MDEVVNQIVTISRKRTVDKEKLISDLVSKIVTEQNKVLKRDLTISICDALNNNKSVDELIVSLNHILNGL